MTKSIKIYDGAVVVWTKTGGHIFNDVPQADKYFQRANKTNQHPRWGRIFEYDTQCRRDSLI